MSSSFPTWAAKEIAEANWSPEGTWKGSGYILDINELKKQIDVQFYEELPDGRYIATLDLPIGFKIADLEKAVVYSFEIKIFAAQLSTKLSELLSKEYSVSISKIYRFEMVSVERLD
ncbi:MAG: hypothetical protein HYU39_02080 [Thaumarchaeota archaeon]|nr:hypothetical protein [Nitrososphaerota archaeon]